MIIYNVTVNVEPSIHLDWLEWMKKVHIPEVLSTGLFLEHKILRVLSIEEGEGHTYSIQYTLENQSQLELYMQEHAPRLQREHIERYRNKFVAFRTILEIV